MSRDDTARDTRQNIRILVADDYDINQKLAHFILQNAGYQVEIVENGLQAVETYQNNPFDLILMDIRMPLMDGYEATKRIRHWEGQKQNNIGGGPDSFFETSRTQASFKQVPIIAMTGDDAECVRATCRKKGMNDCIGKPLKKDRLLSVVQNWTIAGSNIRHNNIEIASHALSPQTASDHHPPVRSRKSHH